MTVPRLAWNAGLVLLVLRDPPMRRDLRGSKMGGTAAEVQEWSVGLLPAGGCAGDDPVADDPSGLV